MKQEQKENLDPKMQALLDSLELTKTGYAGIDKNGMKVDRRIYPDAIPLQKNTLLNIPEPKKV